MSYFREPYGLRVTSRSLKMKFPSGNQQVNIMIPASVDNNSRDSFPDDYNGPFPEFATYRDLVTGQAVYKLRHTRGWRNELQENKIFYGTLKRKGGNFFVHPWTWISVQRESFDDSIDLLDGMVKGKFFHDALLPYRVDFAFEHESDAVIARLLMK